MACFVYSELSYLQWLIGLLPSYFVFLPLLIFFLFLLSSSILSHKVTCTHTHIHIYWVILNILLVSLWVLLFATPVDCSTPGFPVIHYLPQFAQTHVHLVGDAIQPPHPLSSPSPLPSIFPSIFSSESVLVSGGQSISISASASVLPMNIQDWFPLGLTGLISLPSKGLSSIFSNITVQKHQFFGAQFSIVGL